MKQVTIVVLVLVAFLLATCGAQPAPTASPTQAPPGMPNPASKFCVEQGYQSEIRDEADGQKGYCLFPDGSECEEWAFYRGECAPASEGQETAGQLANPASENCVAVGGRGSATSTRTLVSASSARSMPWHDSVARLKSPR